MMAAREGNVGIVRKLIQHGASVNLTNKVNYFKCIHCSLIIATGSLAARPMDACLCNYAAHCFCYVSLVRECLLLLKLQCTFRLVQ